MDDAPISLTPKSPIIYNHTECWCPEYQLAGPVWKCPSSAPAALPKAIGFSVEAFALQTRARDMYFCWCAAVLVA